MTELELALTRLGAGIEFPATPDVADAVRRRLTERAEPRRFGLPTRRMLVLVFALLVVGVGLAMAVPPARTAILEFFGLRGATVERVDTLPPASIAADLQLGKPVTLDEARELAAFDVLVPESLGEPDGVYYSASFTPGGQISLVYKPREELPQTRETGVGLLVTEFRGDVFPELIRKMIGPGTRAEELTVDGYPAVWLEGGPHVLVYRRPDGQILEATARLAGNTLLLERGNLLVRLEGTLARDEAVAIAESLEGN